MTQTNQIHKLSLDQAKEFLTTHFPIQIKEIKPLDSYWDQNFYIKDTQNKEFVFKKTHIDSYESLDLQNKAMEHLKNKGLPVPEIILSKKGEQITKVDKCFIRLLTFLPGKPVVNNSYATELLKNVGILIAKLDKGLQDFSHLAAKRTGFIWDMQNALQLREHTKHIDNKEHLETVNNTLKLFEQQVIPQKESLRKGITHDDVNEFNILSEDSKNISAIIDFGDTVHTTYVSNLAIAIAHFMLRQEEPIVTGAKIYQAYNKEFSLKENEKALLPLLIMTRLVTLITMSTKQKKEDPENNYVGQQIPLAWEVLQKLKKHSLEELRKLFEKE